MILELLNIRLQYISIGSGKVHARRIGASRYNPTVDLSHATLCGRSVPDDAKPESEREMDIRLICGRCYRSLRTFDRGVKAR